MHLIADSGSSKTDWVLCKGKTTIKQIETKGFNPYYYSGEVLENIVKHDLLPILIGDFDIKNIYFYGSGCSTDQNKQIIRNSLLSGFPSTSIEIEHDLLGAARSLFGTDNGIACILGTGSNTAVYDGNNITHNIPSLGYLFGDEGSGSNLGKRFIDQYLKEKLPPEIDKIFELQFNYSFEYILKQVYNSDGPVKFFASFAPFIHQHIGLDFMHDLVYSSFHDFFEQNICKYPDYKNQSLRFVGSIAFIFAGILKEVANEFDMEIQEIRKTPMDGLIEFHS